jgi:4-amino-4-deoxy-L-arabinose transferase-like glycosyltransferase
MIKQHLILLGLVVFSLIVRLVQLQSLPQILNRDEAALAYNAVLLKETGQDEWQQPWPLALESFGDYKLPGYVLTLVGLFHFLPQEDWVVRLPAVLAGVSLVPLAYWVAKNLGYDQKVALVAAALMAATPVFFFYSRMAFEALLALSLWGLTHALLFKQVEPRRQWMVDGTAILVALMASFTYNTPLLLLPFTILLLPIVRGLTQWQNWILPVLGLCLVFMAVSWLLLPLTSQKKGITLFSDETTLTNSITYRQSLPELVQPIIGHKYVYLAGLMAKNLAVSFSPSFLVTHGGAHPWHAQPGFSHLSWTVYALGLLGLVSVVRKSLSLSTELFKQPSKKKKSEAKSWPLTMTRPLLLLVLLVTSLAPSVITVDAPHATRSLPFLWWWIFVTIEGLLLVGYWIKPKLVTKNDQLVPALTSLVLLTSFLEFGWYSYNYFTRFATNQPDALRVGFNQAIQQVEQDYPDTPVAIVDGDGFHYILTAWYLRLSPAEYFATVIRQQPNTIGFRYGEKVANYHFIAQPTDRPKTNETVMLQWTDNHWQRQTF